MSATRTTPRFTVATKPSAIVGGKVWEVFDGQHNRVVEIWAHGPSAKDACRRLNALAANVGGKS